MKFSPIIKFSIVLGAFFYLLKNGELDLKKLFSKELLLNIENILLVIFCISLTYFIGSIRWWLILKSFKYNFKLTEIIKITYIGAFFNNVLFGAYGGDLVKGYYIYKFTKNSLKATLTILFDRIVGFVGLFLVGIYSLISIFDKKIFSIISFKLILITFLLLALIIFFIYIFYKKKVFSKKINKYLNEFIIYLNLNKKNILFFILLSSLLFTIVHISVYIISDIILYFDLGVKKVFFLNFFTTLVNTVPITPGGIGIGEIAFVNLNNFFFTNQTNFKNIANIILLYRLINLVVCLPGAVIYIFQKKKL